MNKGNNVFHLLKITTITAAAVMLCSCSLLRTEYVRPALDVQAVWENGISESVSGKNADTRFWESFRDPVLNELIDAALKSNNDYQAAKERVLQAFYSAKQIGTNINPTASASLSSGRTWMFSDGKDVTNSSSSSLGISYEVDLFGRLKAERDSAAHTYQASEEDLQATRLALIFQAADYYWNIGYYNDLLRLNRENLSDSENILEIIREKYESGSVARYELLEIERNVLSDRKTIEENSESLKKLSYELSSLMDKAPSVGSKTGYSVSGLFVPKVRPGIPSDILINRPDIRAAEEEVKAQLADVDVSRLNFLPSFSLTGLLGTASNDLISFSGSPKGQVGGSITFPFLNFNQLNYALKGEEAAYRAKAADFVSTYYKALSEVESALAKLKRIESTMVLVKSDLEKASEMEKIYLERYKSGSIELKDYLEIREKRRSQEINYLYEQYEHLSTTMELYKTLGGRAG